MKFTFFLAIVTFLSLVAFVSCEKDNSQLQTTSNCVNTQNEEEDYRIIDPMWQILDKSYSDEFGNIGVLYVNSKNTAEKQFVIYTESKTEPRKWDGTYQTKTITLPNGTSTIEYSCDKTEASNCRIEVTKDVKGNIISCEIILKG
jgi:hypothetical protein